MRWLHWLWFHRSESMTEALERIEELQTRNSVALFRMEIKIDRLKDGNNGAQVEHLRQQLAASRKTLQHAVLSAQTLKRGNDHG